MKKLKTYKLFESSQELTKDELKEIIDLEIIDNYTGIFDADVYISTLDKLPGAYKNIIIKELPEYKNIIIKDLPEYKNGDLKNTTELSICNRYYTVFITIKFTEDHIVRDLFNKIDKTYIYGSGDNDARSKDLDRGVMKNQIKSNASQYVNKIIKDLNARYDFKLSYLSDSTAFDLDSDRHTVIVRLKCRKT